MSDKIKLFIGAIAIAIAATLLGLVVNLKFNSGAGEAEVEIETPKVEIEYSEEQIPAIIEGDQGDLIEDTEIPTVEEIDGGGLFEDYQSVTGRNGLTTDVYYDVGAIESVDTSSFEAFKASVLGRCIIANNYYGAQCVSLARAFWWSYAGFDITTCGTGLAKGIVECWEENARDKFRYTTTEDTIIKGSWVTLGGSYTGHICEAAGPAVNGYVACLGENQGGASCGANVGGSAANIINLSLKNLLGVFTPISYIPVEPEPEPEPKQEPIADRCSAREVVKGDTMGKIMKECTGKIEWGAAMDEYAKHWYSTKYLLYPTVYAGWASDGGYGLFAGDVIEYRD